MINISSKRDACLAVISALADADLRSKLVEIPALKEKSSVNSFTDFKNLLDKDLDPIDLTKATCEFIEFASKGSIKVTCNDLMELAEMAE